jgi:ribosome-associated toxin RatA of RatAB toxin-antitoxin module
VELVVDFQFKSHLLDHVANDMFHEAAARMMDASCDGPRIVVAQGSEGVS